MNDKKRTVKRAASSRKPPTRPQPVEVQLASQRGSAYSPQVLAGQEYRPKLSREEALYRKILAAVEEQPGILQHELARRLGEKAIIVLSGVDQLLSRGQLARLERGELYLPAARPAAAAPEETAAQAPREPERAEVTLVWARTVYTFYQMIRKAPDVSLEINRQWMRIFYLQRKILAVRRYVHEARCEISVYGNFREPRAAELLRQLGLSESRLSAGGDLVTFKCRGFSEVMRLRPQLARLVEYAGHQHYLVAAQSARAGGPAA
ncbi:hypothetical protein HS125_20135 [bacterium]|nr:hypothetical protein [bacterium]